MVAVFAASFSNGRQIGMIFELYRNCAGYHEQMVQDIQSTIRVPVCQREDGELYHQKIALKLGKHDNIPCFHPRKRLLASFSSDQPRLRTVNVNLHTIMVWGGRLCHFLEHII
jgi:hypothetical protein